MLTRLQQKYAEKPVRFLLFPCNQFANQEPKTNFEIRAFAEQHVAVGWRSTVRMFAKTNVNNVDCTYGGRDVCATDSADCCPLNDVVYKTLLAEASPGTIKWNFDKIIVNQDGYADPSASIFHGPALDDVLSDEIDKLLGESFVQADASINEFGYTNSMDIVAWHARVGRFCVSAMLVGAALSVSMLVARRVREAPVDSYILVD